jgi:hypothetical protein
MPYLNSGAGMMSILGPLLAAMGQGDEDEEKMRMGTSSTVSAPKQAEHELSYPEKRHKARMEAGLAGTQSAGGGNGPMMMEGFGAPPEDRKGKWGDMGGDPAAKTPTPGAPTPPTYEGPPLSGGTGEARYGNINTGAVEASKRAREQGNTGTLSGGQVPTSPTGTKPGAKGGAANSLSGVPVAGREEFDEDTWNILSDLLGNGRR